VCAALIAAPAGAEAFSGNQELLNFSKITERELHVTLTPDFLTQLLTQTALAPVQFAQQLAADPERQPANICGIHGFECAGDVRFYNWGANGHGIVRPVLFTARDGATLSGHVWATRAGPPKRPLIVITTGSVQAPEQLYWGQAATLAKHGYVVLTYDVQGQGSSDLLGEGADQFEGVPSQSGEPFYDGTEDALNFALSTPSHPYEPVPSCSTGTSHTAKQDRRVAAGLDAPYNPLSDLVDPSRVGIAGHSLGAAAVSFVGQKDPRVKATVAWDNLGVPAQSVAGSPLSVPSCASNPASRMAPPITKPAMGISNDYGIVPQPFTSDPNPQGKNDAFLAYRSARVDSAEVVIRGGCHEESAFIPGVVTGVYPLSCGTLRGNDLVAWYSTAWFDKYVKGDGRLGDRELLSDRWRSRPPARRQHVLLLLPLALRPLARRRWARRLRRHARRLPEHGPRRLAGELQHRRRGTYPRRAKLHTEPGRLRHQGEGEESREAVCAQASQGAQALLEASDQAHSANALAGRLWSEKARRTARRRRTRTRSGSRPGRRSPWRRAAARPGRRGGAPA